MRRETKNPRGLKVTRYADLLIELNKYLDLSPRKFNWKNWCDGTKWNFIE